LLCVKALRKETGGEQASRGGQSVCYLVDGESSSSKTEKEQKKGMSPLERRKGRGTLTTIVEVGGED